LGKRVTFQKKEEKSEAETYRRGWCIERRDCPKRIAKEEGGKRGEKRSQEEKK